MEFWWGNLKKDMNGKPARKWENNIELDLQEIGSGFVHWIWLRVGTSVGLF